MIDREREARALEMRRRVLEVELERKLREGLLERNLEERERIEQRIRGRLQLEEALLEKNLQVVIFPLGPLFAQPLSNKQQTTGSSFTGINIIY